MSFKEEEDKLDILNSLLVDIHIKKCVLLLSNYDMNMINNISQICLSKLHEIMHMKEYKNKQADFAYLFDMYGLFELTKFDKKKSNKSSAGGGSGSKSPPRKRSPTNVVQLPPDNTAMVVEVASSNIYANHVQTQLIATQRCSSNEYDGASNEYDGVSNAGKTLIEHCQLRVNQTRHARDQALALYDEKKIMIDEQTEKIRNKQLEVVNNDFKKLENELNTTDLKEKAIASVFGVAGGWSAYNITSYISSAFVLASSFIVNVVVSYYNLLNVFRANPCYGPSNFMTPFHEPGTDRVCSVNLGGYGWETCTMGSGRCVGYEGNSFGVDEVTPMVIICVAVFSACMAYLGTRFITDQTKATNISRGFLSTPADALMKASLIGWFYQVLKDSEALQEKKGIIRRGLFEYQKEKGILDLNVMLKKRSDEFFEKEERHYVLNLENAEKHLQSAEEMLNKTILSITGMMEDAVGAQYLVNLNRAGVTPHVQSQFLLNSAAVAASTMKRENRMPVTLENSPQSKENNVLLLKDKSSAGGARLKKRITKRKGYLKNRKTKKRVMYRKRK